MKKTMIAGAAAIALAAPAYAGLSWNRAWDLCEKAKLDVTVGVS